VHFTARHPNVMSLSRFAAMSGQQLPRPPDRLRAAEEKTYPGNSCQSRSDFAEPDTAHKRWSYPRMLPGIRSATITLAGSRLPIVIKRLILAVRQKKGTTDSTACPKSLPKNH
jgi:hypothetical protein